MVRTTNEQYIMDRIKATDSGCWDWQLAALPHGYSPWKRHDRYYNVGVHRVAYMIFKGPIPEGYQVDHLCFNRRCVNPDHLDAVTPSVNTARSKTRQWADHRYSLILTKRNLWIARIRIAGERCEFRSRDRDVAAAKADAFLEANGGVHHGPREG